MTAFLKRVEDCLWNLDMKSSLPSATDMLSSMWNPPTSRDVESDNGDESPVTGDSFEVYYFTVS